MVASSTPSATANPARTLPSRPNPAPTVAVTAVPDQVRAATLWSGCTRVTSTGSTGVAVTLLARPASSGNIASRGCRSPPTVLVSCPITRSPSLVNSIASTP